MICRGSSSVKDSVIHHITEIAVWIDNTSNPISCEVVNCHLTHCREGIRCYSTILSVFLCHIDKVTIGIHSDHSLSIQIQQSCIHECKGHAMIVKNTRFFQLLACSVYDCSSGCDFTKIQTCYLLDNCFAFIKNKLFFFTSCFVSVLYRE